MPNFRSVYLQIKPETDNERSRKVYTGKGKPVSVEIDGNSKRLAGSRQGPYARRGRKLVWA